MPSPAAIQLRDAHARYRDAIGTPAAPALYRAFVALAEQLRRTGRPA